MSEWVIWNLFLKAVVYMPSFHKSDPVAKEIIESFLYDFLWFGGIFYYLFTVWNFQLSSVAMEFCYGIFVHIGFRKWTGGKFIVKAVYEVDKMAGVTVRLLYLHVKGKKGKGCIRTKPFYSFYLSSK